MAGGLLPASAGSPTRQTWPQLPARCAMTPAAAGRRGRPGHRRHRRRRALLDYYNLGEQIDSGGAAGGGGLQYPARVAAVYRDPAGRADLVTCSGRPDPLRHAACCELLRRRGPDRKMEQLEDDGGRGGVWHGRVGGALLADFLQRHRGPARSLVDVGSRMPCWQGHSSSKPVRIITASVENNAMTRNLEIKGSGGQQHDDLVANDRVRCVRETRAPVPATSAAACSTSKQVQRASRSRRR